MDRISRIIRFLVLRVAARCLPVARALNSVACTGKPAPSSRVKFERVISKFSSFTRMTSNPRFLLTSSVGGVRGRKIETAPFQSHNPKS